jgi:hypothetical protein
MIKVIATGQIGTVVEVHQIGDGYVYGVQLRTERGRYVRVQEAELELLKPANADETGLHIRYVT